MKLAAFALVTTLGLGGAVHADVAPAEAPPARAEAARPDGARTRSPIHRALLERFDANHDGRLEARERRRAVRALRRLARRIAMQDHRDARRDPRGLTRRFDANHDGVVGPDEMPPGLARKLRTHDHNRDGWIDDRDRRTDDRRTDDRRTDDRRTDRE